MLKELIQTEIEIRRLKKYAQKIAKNNYDKNYSELSFNELKDILSIIDKYGSKYLQFYKFNDENDKLTFMSNLENYSYVPIFNFGNEEELKKVFIKKYSNKTFELMFNFKVIEEEWFLQNEDTKIKIKKPRRRVLYIHNIANYVILAIDPIGLGRVIGGYKHLEKYKKQVDEILKNPLFDRLVKLNIEDAIKTLIKNLTFTARGVKYEEKKTAREFSTICKNSKDNLKDIIVKLPENINIQDLKLKYGKISLELFNNDLLKINSRATEDEHNELKTSIISILQKQ